MESTRRSWTFGTLLGWHIRNGTCSQRDKLRAGEAWTYKAFAGGVGAGGISAKQLRLWRADKQKPEEANYARLQNLLFSREDTEARAEFRGAYDSWGKSRDELETPSPDDTGALDPVWCLAIVIDQNSRLEGGYE
jgi:hypothetical protein